MGGKSASTSTGTKLKNNDTAVSMECSHDFTFNFYDLQNLYILNIPCTFLTQDP
jgi:hypothetical protein